jgi:ComF family protein
LSAIDGIRATAAFTDNPLRSAIHEFKYNNHRAVTVLLGERLLTSYRQYGLKAEVIVPVPLHEAKLKERGYNQSELLARQLNQALNLPLNLTTLRRVRKTESQMTLGAEERYKNVSGAFACEDKSLAQRHILLVDDVCTTGSTLDACAAALKAGGAASVWGLTLAKA